MSVGIQSWVFAGFNIDSARRLLLHEGEVLPLPRKSVEILLLLLQQPGRLITRDELLQQVWRGAIVEDNSLAQAISALRRALGDSAAVPRLIETVARHGYRFIGTLDAAAAAPAAPLPSVSVATALAVLPFRTVGGAGLDYLGIGLADAVVARLAGLRGIQVRPGSQVRALGEGLDALAAGRRLGVQAVLDGYVRQLNEQLTVSVQLIDVGSGEVLWAERLGEHLDDVFEVEERIAERLAQTLAPNLQRQRQPNADGTRDAEAYRLFLKGHHAGNLLSLHGFQQAREAYTAALARDPGFARAWQGLAHAFLNASDLWLPAVEAMSEARRCAQRALWLDPSLAPAHCALAAVSLWFDRDLDACERALGLALSNDPEGAATLRLAGWLRALCGAHTEAEVLLARSTALDPYDLELHLMAAGAHYFTRRYGAAIEAARRMQQANPDSWLANLLIGRCFEAQGELAVALAHYRLAYQCAPAVAEVQGELGRALAASGDHVAARSLLAQLDASSILVPAFVRAQILLGLGERAAALVELERTLQERSWFASWLICAPLFDGLLEDASYQKLRRRALLPVSITG